MEAFIQEWLTPKLQELERELLKKSKNFPHLSRDLILLACDELKAQNIDPTEPTGQLIDKMVDFVKSSHEQELRSLIEQKERIEHQIERKKEELKSLLKQTFEGIEEASKEVDKHLKEMIVKRVEEKKLVSLELLGILGETTEAALIAALEKGDEIEETVYEITKNISFQALGEGKLTAPRVADITRTILQHSADVAEATPNYAKPLLRGSAYGLKDGITKALARFQEELENMPPEAREVLVGNYRQTLRDLENIKMIYAQIIKETAGNSGYLARSILMEISEELEESFYELKKVSGEAIDAIKSHLSYFAKETATIGAELRSKATEEAKRLGQRAFKIAKAATLGAIKGAKEALKEENK